MTSVGVLPLVCVCCERVVGVINEDALARMLGAEDVYLCSACDADEAMVEQRLALQPPDFYPRLVSRALLSAELDVAIPASGPSMHGPLLSVARVGMV